MVKSEEAGMKLGSLEGNFLQSVIYSVQDSECLHAGVGSGICEGLNIQQQENFKKISHKYTLHLLSSCLYEKTKR